MVSEGAFCSSLIFIEILIFQHFEVDCWLVLRLLASLLNVFELADQD
jgi:hypothetical protein